MKSAKRWTLPSPAIVLAALALIVAVGGTAIAGPTALKSALNKREKKQTKRIAKSQILGLQGQLSVANAQNANNAAQLGGVPPSGYHKPCSTGTIKGSLVVDTGGFTPGVLYTEEGSRFNCGGGAVVMRMVSPGVYNVNFVGGAGGTGSAVVTADGLGNIATYDRVPDPEIGNQIVFQVTISDAAGVAAANRSFTLLAF